MKSNQDTLLALLGTVILHLLVLLILYFTVLRTEVPVDESAIMVNFGDVTASTGVVEPRNTAAAVRQETPPPLPKSKVAGEELLTQETEETVAAPVQKQKERDERAAREREKQEEDARKRAEDEHLRQERQQQQQREAIDNRMSNAFGSTPAEETQPQQGATETAASNQGNPYDDAANGSNNSGSKIGAGLNLDGRTVRGGVLPRPTFEGQQEGRIVIQITVDPEGNVILAEPYRGTNIDNPMMRKSAIEAAKRTKFNKIKGNNQIGTITYNYKLI